MLETATAIHNDTTSDFQALLDAARRMTTDLGPEVDSMLMEGLARPLSPLEAERLLAKVIESIRTTSAAIGGSDLDDDVHELVAMATAARDRVRASIGASVSRMAKIKTVQLIPEHNGVRAGAVVPTPVFHEKEIPVEGGFIKTTDIRLWGKNERLEIHVDQFQAKFGRPPTPEELFHIMMGKMPLEGLEPGDEFDVLKLARSIATNGVRKPPIIDIDGSLLDGNRRIAACMLIIGDTSGEFTADEKKRAEYIYVWQLTVFATDDDRQKVIVSLNFESDFKKEWPEYIKARKVFEDWEAMLALEPQRPGPRRQAELKRELSRKYALGPDTTIVNRYVKMVSLANEFEDHHINVRNRDSFAVKHGANRHFQYFDELGKGEKPGGVLWSLNQDEHFKQIVFDLLFDGKFENWRQIRALKHVFESDEARDILGRAHHELDVETAKEHVESAITIANVKRAEQRSLGANLRIETFTKWLEEVPPRTLRDEVKRESLNRFLRALELVEPLVRQILQEGVGEVTEA